MAPRDDRCRRRYRAPVPARRCHPRARPDRLEHLRGRLACDRASAAQQCSPRCRRWAHYDPLLLHRTRRPDGLPACIGLPSGGFRRLGTRSGTRPRVDGAAIAARAGAAQGTRRTRTAAHPGGARMTANAAMLPHAYETAPALGGAMALAESAWMGAAQASDILEPVRIAAPRQQLLRFPIPQISLRRVLTGELTITEASIVLMASFFFSAVLGAVRQVLFNAAFGAGVEANAYYAAFRLPDTLFSLIAGGALSSAMIPVLLSTRREEGEEDAQRLTSLVLNVLLLAILLITAVAELTAPLFVRHVLVPGYASGTQDLAIRLTRIMLLQPIILVAGSVAIAVLNSRNQFLLTALSVASHNLALIAGIVATATDPRLGIYGPTLGVIAGAVLQVLIVLPGVIGSGARYHPAWNLSDPRLREVLHLLVPNGVAVGVAYTGFIVDTAFASGASDAASLAAIQNAWLLVGLPIALLGQAIGQGAFPRLAAHAAAGEYRELRRTLVRAL